jgi:hypothetical protein
VSEAAIAALCEPGFGSTVIMQIVINVAINLFSSVINDMARLALEFVDPAA